PRAERDLIASLDGFCVQDDFDVVVTGLPKPLQCICLQTLVGTLLAKECMVRFFMNAFWYLVPQPTSDAGEEKPPINTAGFEDQILTLYRNMLDSNPSDAHHWRIWTTRFSNADNAFGNNMAAHRKSMVDRICEEIFGQELLQSLLRNSDQNSRDQALGELKEHFNFASDLSVRISAKLQYLHNHQLNGRRILYMQSPAIWVCERYDIFRRRSLERPATVYVEDRESPSSS
ncbi:hypothetical protein BO94DRAFT_478676, partial [Aspergillus sclerotioniger CBS 115572]